jgi:hypothetical protein
MEAEKQVVSEERTEFLRGFVDGTLALHSEDMGLEALAEVMRRKIVEQRKRVEQMEWEAAQERAAQKPQVPFPQPGLYFVTPDAQGQVFYALIDEVVDLDGAQVMRTLKDVWEEVVSETVDRVGAVLTGADGKTINTGVLTGRILGRVSQALANSQEAPE